jgi:MFS family permease
VYTPILPIMVDALAWSKAQAGLIASANFLGYLFGAMAALPAAKSSCPRHWLIAALTVSGLSTLAMGLTHGLPHFLILRFVGGAASAFVIVCGSTLVLDQLAAIGRRQLSFIHFAGVGVGIMASATLVACLMRHGADWNASWIWAGLLVVAATPFVAWLTHDVPRTAPSVFAARRQSEANSTLTRLIVAYGLFGFGYVITATFLVAIVRQSDAIRAIEPWVWGVFGLAAIPSVPFWTWAGTRLGGMKAFALACLVEAIGVAASVELPTAMGAFSAATLLGGTFMGLTALGLIGARELSPAEPESTSALMTASFAAGQLLGPITAGLMSDWLGSFRGGSLLGALALLGAAALAGWSRGGDEITAVGSLGICARGSGLPGKHQPM